MFLQLSDSVQHEQLTFFENEYYSIHVVKSWKYNPGIGKKTKIRDGLDCYRISFNNPIDRNDFCGLSFSISTIMHPQQSKIKADSVYHQDSVQFSTLKEVVAFKNSFVLVNDMNIRTFDSVHESINPGTNILEKANCKTWYIEGTKNLHKITFCSCNYYWKFLPIIEKEILKSFKEK